MKRLYVLLCFVFICVYGQVNAQNIRYVKSAASGNGDGSSWNNASDDLQAIINDSAEGTEIWVAKGIYKPNRRADDVENLTPNDRNNSFVLKANVHVYGGFSGDESTKDNRDFITNETILSGNIGNPDIQEDNSFHVVSIVGEMGDKTIFDGFSVEGGYTQQVESAAENLTINGYAVPNTRSPGIIAYFVNFMEFRNLIVRDNVNASSGQNAGALYMFQASGNLRNVKFINNRTLFGSGGAMYTYGIASLRATINFYDVEFINNVSANNAGAIYMGQYSDSFFYNCNFQGNQAVAEGGAIYLGSASATGVFNNTDFVENQAQTRGGAVRAPNSGRLSFRGGIFRNNKSTVSNAGGALSATASGLILDIDRITFEGNSNSSSGGGAIYFGTGTYTISNSVFKDNVGATVGGAIYFEPNAISVSRITNTDFINNVAGTQGGAIYITGANTSAEIVSCRFYNNASTTSGGALAALTNATLNVINSIVYGNEAQTTSSTGGGGAAYLSGGGRINFYNSTIAYNTVSTTRKAGAFYLAANTQVNLYNSISFGNRGGSTVTNNAEHENFVTSGATVTLRNSLTEYFGTTDPSLGNVVAPSFSFVSTNLGNAGFLEIDPTNSASVNVIDKGVIADVPVTLDVDALGKGRIYNGRIDIGALEYLGAPKLDPTVVTIEENATVGTNVVVPNKSILETPLTWSITGGNDSGAFAINSETGQISVVASEPLNYEVVRQFELTVLAQGAIDNQKITVIVNIDNVAEAPEKPQAENIFQGNIVTSYKPTLFGVAEASSILTLYVDGVKYPAVILVGEDGNWKFKFPENLSPGFHEFSATSTVDGEESDRSPALRINLKLYGGGTMGIQPNNILTPNGDGKNDVWLIGNLAEMYPEHQILIFDKTGKAVFKWDSKVDGPYDANNYNNNAWDGRSNGNPLAAGTYYYHINIGKGLDKIKGAITIVRAN